MWHKNKKSAGKIVDENFERSFLHAVNPVIITAQVFGLFPISGLRENDPEHIKFTWISFRTIFSLSFQVYCVCVTVSVLIHQVKTAPLSPSNIVGVIFFTNCSLTCIFFFKFSTKFGELMIRWNEVEKSLSKSFSEEDLNWSLKKRLRLFTCISLLLALLEHLMSLASHGQQVIYRIDVCNKTTNNILEDFITKHLYFTFNFITYNPVAGILAEYYNISFTISWNFLDFFIILICIGLASNYNKINGRISYFRDRSMPDFVWSEIREKYNEVSELVKYVDKLMDKMIILACCNDAYFVIVQLLNIVTVHKFVVDKIYYYYSMTFLICRVSATFLFASSIYESSRKPLQIIRTTPNEGWRQEVERFREQIVHEENALTGMKLFCLTRKSLFALAGAILMYEIVLLQFSTAEKDRDEWVKCDG